MTTTTASPQRAAGDLLSQIGDTPMIELRRSSPKPEVKIWAKLELANPSGSLKDRIALHMMERAEARGDLEPGMTIVEATSGNTGIALGMVAAVKGYKLKLFMLENKTLERRKMLRYWGADLELTTKDDPDSHIYGAKKLIAESPGDYFYIDQNENPDNLLLPITQRHRYQARPVVGNEIQQRRQFRYRRVIELDHAWVRFVKVTRQRVLAAQGNIRQCRHFGLALACGMQCPSNEA